AAAATHFTVSAPSSATAGSAFSFTVTGLDQFNNTATGYTGTVHFTSSDGQASLPADTTLTNGVGGFSATLRTAGNQTLTATDSQPHPHGHRHRRHPHHLPTRRSPDLSSRRHALHRQRSRQRHRRQRLQLHHHGAGSVQQYGHGLRRHGALHEQRWPGVGAGE